MWFFKKKIKENNKQGLYGNKYNSGSYVSGWDNLGLIEQICMIFLPIMLCGMLYIMLEMSGVIWWGRLLISISSVTLLMTLISFLVSYFIER